jgi:hypothetical protein
LPGSDRKAEDTLLVARVEPYSPGDECACVTLRSAQAEIVAFCHPCELQAGDRVENHLHTMDAEVRAAYLSDWPEEEKQERSKPRLERVGPYAYRGCGTVVDRMSGVVEVLGFRIDLGDAPCDGPVEFEITRLDV